MEHTPQLFRDLIVLFGMAMLIAFLMRKARQPTIVGYLITGVVAGPSALKLIPDTAGVEVLAEVGVALLLFTIGIEFSLEKLSRMRDVIVGAGGLQVLVTVAGTGLALWAIGFAGREAVFWGFLVAASSTAIVIKLLHERHELDTVHGRIILGVLLFQDICVVPMMAIVPALAAPGTAQALNIMLALLKSLAVVAGILLGARYLFPPMLRAIVLLRSRELFVIAAMFFALGTAWGASHLGLSLALGAFLSGIVISESEYGHQILADILPFRDVLNSLFFISVGMLINLEFIWANLPWLLAVSALVIGGKALAAAVPVMAMRYPLRLAAMVGLSVAQVGEFSFVLLREGARLNLIPESRYQLFLAAAVLTMMLTPALMGMAGPLSTWLGKRSRAARDIAPAREEPGSLRDHVIICGYGLNGQRLARLLKENAIPYVVVDMNHRSVRSARREGELIYFGDVSNAEILHRAGGEQARAIVFAISDPAILPRAISQARLINPNVHLIARTKRMQDVDELRTAGATDVIAEELEAWMEIVVRVLRLYGMPRELVAEQILHLREGDYAMVRTLPVPGQPLHVLHQLLPQVQVELVFVVPDSELVGKTVRSLDLRARTGALIIALVRDADVVHNPPPEFQLESADQILVLGTREQIAAATIIFRSPDADSIPAS
jgi:CPA2 family monovalent cation:H+ antiporter-2